MDKVASMAEKRAANALSGRSIAFIGGGAMAGAMIGGLLNSHVVEAKAMTASDPHADRTKDLESRFGVATTSENLKAARNADIVILSVKPQMLRFVFRDLCGKLRKDALVLSIIAGARIESMTQGLKHTSIVRSMPNTPAQVAEGMTVWTASTAVTPAAARRGAGHPPCVRQGAVRGRRGVPRHGDGHQRVGSRATCSCSWKR